MFKSWINFFIILLFLILIYTIYILTNIYLLLILSEFFWILSFFLFLLINNFNDDSRLSSISLLILVIATIEVSMSSVFLMIRNKKI